MIVLDTTVLVYAVGDDHRLRDPARAVVESVEDGSVQATTTVEVVQEFAHVRARRRSRGDAAGLARSYADLFAPLITVDVDDLLAGLRLFSREGGLGMFDAVLASTAMRRGAHALVSADSGFAHVRGLRHLDPGDPDFVESLAAQR